MDVPPAGLGQLRNLLAPLGPLETTLRHGPIDAAVLDPSARPASDAASAFFRLSRVDAGFLVDCRRYGQFQFDARATRIQVWRDPRTSEDEFNHYMNSAIAAVLFELRGALALHASAVVIDGMAHLFLGHSGAGKSTVAAGLLDAGAELLADDITPVCAARTAYPGLQLLRLSSPLPGAVRRTPTGLHGDKRLFGPPQSRCSAAPVGSITLLEQRGKRLQWQRLDEAGSWRALWSHGYAARLTRRLGIEAVRLDASARLVAGVPFYRLKLPEGLGELSVATQRLAQLLRAASGSPWDTPLTAATA